jgi:hypothetical protein
LVEALNGFQRDPQLRDQGLYQEGMGEDDALVHRQGQGALDGLKPLMDSVLTSKVMLTQEPLRGAAAGELGGFERGPLTEKVTKQPRLLIGKPLENLRQMSFQGTGQSIGYADPIAHQSTTVFNPLAQGSHVGTLGHQWLEFIPVPKQQFQLELSLAGIVLGSARGKSFPISRQPHRIDRKEHKPLLLA